LVVDAKLVEYAGGRVVDAKGRSSEVRIGKGVGTQRNGRDGLLQTSEAVGYSPDVVAQSAGAAVDDGGGHVGSPVIQIPAAEGADAWSRAIGASFGAGLIAIERLRDARAAAGGDWPALRVANRVHEVLAVGLAWLIRIVGVVGKCVRLGKEAR